MLIVGVYPDFVSDGQAASALELLKTFIDSLPPAVALHLLPFGRSNGDGGFALEDWASVSPSLGDWSTISELATRRKLMVDGVYNHVGLGHEWVKTWLDQGRHSERLAVYPFLPEVDFISPRGGSVFRPHQIDGRTWWAWQTFSDFAIDVDLSNADVMTAVNQHLHMLKERRIWGLRLDSVAYYGKDRLGRQRHQPRGIQFARSIAEQALREGLTVVPQLNCDSWGRRYFGYLRRPGVPLTDFAYSALTCLAIVSGDVKPLIAHLNRLEVRSLQVLRTPRSHDGILLKTPLLRSTSRNALCRAFEKYEIYPRLIEGRPYEFNCSLPFLCGLGVSESDRYARLLSTMVLTGSLSGVCYFYAPALCGIRPEEKTTKSNAPDPRSLNRRRVNSSELEQIMNGEYFRQVIRLLGLLSGNREWLEVPGQDVANTVQANCDGAVTITRDQGRFVSVVNFSSREIPVPVDRGELVFGNRITGSSCGPYGCGIWRS